MWVLLHFLLQDGAADAMAQDSTPLQHQPWRDSSSSMQEDGAGEASDRQQQSSDTMPCVYGIDAGSSGSSSSGLSGAALRNYFAQQLMSPEWMTDIPPDLAANW